MSAISSDRCEMSSSSRGTTSGSRSAKVLARVIVEKRWYSGGSPCAPVPDHLRWARRPGIIARLPVILDSLVPMLRAAVPSLVLTAALALAGKTGPAPATAMPDAKNTKGLGLHVDAT